MVREAAAVGAASGVCEGELFVSDVVVDGSPAGRVSEMWRRRHGGALG